MPFTFATPKPPVKPPVKKDPPKKPPGKKGDPKKPPPAPPKPSLDKRIATDAALRKRVLADPGLRSRLSDGSLKKYAPNHMAARKTTRFRTNLGNVGAPLTGDSMLEVAQGLVDSEYKPLYDGIDRDETKVKAREVEQRGQSKSLYEQAGQQSSALAQAQAAANASAAAQVQAQGTATQGAIDATDTASRERAAADAAVRGGGLDGGSVAELAKRTVEAKNAAAADTQTAATSQGAIGANYEGLLRAGGAISTARGQEAQTAIGRGAADALGELAASRSGLRDKQRGAFTDTVLKMRQSEGDRLLTEKTLATEAEKAILDAKTEALKIKGVNARAAAERALKIKLARMGASEAEARAMAQQVFQSGENAANRETRASEGAANREATAEERRKDRESRERIAEEARKTAARKKDGTAFTPTQIQGARDKVSSAKTLARRLQGLKVTDRGEALDLITERTGSALAARIAVAAFYDRQHGGKIPAHLLAEAEKGWGLTPVEVKRLMGV